MLRAEIAFRLPIIQQVVDDFEIHNDIAIVLRTVGYGIRYSLP